MSEDQRDPEDMAHRFAWTAKKIRRENEALKNNGSPFSKATAHLSKETERGKHSPKIEGHKTSQHSGQSEPTFKDHMRMVNKMNKDMAEAKTERYKREKNYGQD